MEKEYKKILIKYSIKFGVCLLIVGIMAFAVFSPYGFGWFANNQTVVADGLSLSVKESDPINFEEAYFGKFDLSEKMNFGIDDSLLLYPQNYITVTFSLSKNIEFGIEVKQRKLNKNQFEEFFGNRRDLLLGNYEYGTGSEEYDLHFDAESVFPFSSCENNSYEEFIDGLPARPSIILNDSSDSAFNVARQNYTENSMPYLTDFLYRFLQENSMHKALTFSLYVTAGGTETQYLLLPENDEDGVTVKYVPSFYRANDNSDWTLLEEELVLSANVDDDSVSYALVLGYGTEYYEKDGNGVICGEPLTPTITITDQNNTLNFDPPTGGQSVSPYSGTYSTNDYNCFIGSALLVQLGGTVVSGS